MASETVLFRARVSAERLEKAQIVLDKLGLKPGDALNMMLAQIDIRQALPFEVTTHPNSIISAEEQAEQWTEAMGAY